MSTVPDTTEVEEAISGHDPVSRDPLDLSVLFDQWVDDVQTSLQRLAPEDSETEEQDNSEIFIGSFPGSSCEVAFEGVLHFDGYSFGNITSPEGTLVLTKRGRIEADINVGVAVIGGSVTGNITASQRVVLESDARVTGQIYTPALSVRLGAIFDGECLSIPVSEAAAFEDEFKQERSDEFKPLAAFAGA